MIDKSIRDAIQEISDRVAAEKGNARNGAGGREYSLAATKLDEAFMWLVAAQEEVSK